jgi:hypothetical protein
VTNGSNIQTLSQLTVATRLSPFAESLLTKKLMSLTWIGDRPKDVPHLLFNKVWI